MELNNLKRGDRIKFDYVNWEGKQSRRSALFVELSYGSTEYHPEPQFFISGYDNDKKGMRTYAIKDISNFLVNEVTWLYTSSLPFQEVGTQ